ncbi:MAG: spirocyclase AveC family protein [Solirubrobacteraceae bacterium]
MSSTIAREPASARAALAEPIERRKTLPITAWSVIGAAVLALFVYVFAHWILSGQAHTTPTGVTPVPSWMKTMALVQQVVFGAGSLALFYLVVVREWRRAGHLTLNGMSYICIATAWWQDSFLNYIQPQITYNSQLVNFGSWDASLPGWVSPNAAHFPSPIVWYLGVYPLLFCGATIVVLRGMAWARSRWLRLGNVGLVAGTYAFLALFAFTFEFFFVRTGMYQYGGFGGPRIFPSHTYAFPIGVPILDSAVWTMWAAVLFFRNDKGETIAERGVEQLRFGGRSKRALRLLALFGICNVGYIVTYNIPAQLFGLHANSWPRAIQQRSYFTDELCGQGTNVACPGGAVPIPKGSSSLRVGPDGKLVIPAGTTPPKLIPLSRR